MLPVIGTFEPWADPSVVEINRIAMRVPRDNHSRISLNGTWKLRLWSSPDAVPPSAVGATAPSPTGWKGVTVPGNWTVQGFNDLPHYTNIAMPFEGPPPRLPEKNTTGVYRRTMKVPGMWRKRGGRVVVHIGGAESVHALYVNGEFVGYGTDSRLPSEYDVTDVVHGGVNSIAVVVVRYSAHSYIEDQDQWWMAGLHRDVWVEHRPAMSIGQVACVADWNPATQAASLRVTAHVDGVVERGATIMVGIRELPSEPVRSVDVPHRHTQAYVYEGPFATASWDDIDIDPWSAENPTLYTVMVKLLSSEREVIDECEQRVGFRRAEVTGGLFRVNGVAVTICGVNRHDHHPDKGKAVSVDDIRADLVLMKQHNFNAVRTAHYPNRHELLDLCDELGLYVVDEANIESHAYNTSLCNDGRYQSAWVSRATRMVDRDRNHPCVIMWSLGNESGYGRNHKVEAAAVRALDAHRPLHYEGAIFHADWHDGGMAETDVVCPMYPQIDAIVAYARKGGDRPLIMCEYSHAMGNSNGSLADYWAAIDQYEQLQGGFIWEWKDHGLRQEVPRGKHARERFAYGGQFGDEPNDGNFVADGLISPDGIPHPAMREAMWLFRPIRVTPSNRPDAVTVHNMQSFEDLSAYVGRVSLLLNGETLRVEEVSVDLGAGLSRDMMLPFTLNIVRQPSDEVSLLVEWLLRAPTSWAQAGHLVAWEQILVSSAVAL